jgi:uncharacterized protein (DUF433 family)
MDYTKVITMETGKRHGKPCIRGMRIAVSDVLGSLAGGMRRTNSCGSCPISHARTSAPASRPTASGAWGKPRSA